MTYDVWTDHKPDLVAATSSRARAFDIAATHAETGAVLVTEHESGRSWVITRVINLNLSPRIELPADRRELVRD